MSDTTCSSELNGHSLRTSASAVTSPSIIDVPLRRTKSETSTWNAKFPDEDAFRITTFPWIALSIHDAQLLRRHAQALISEDTLEAQQTCHMLADATMHDFPTEVFLQRPAVVQALCTLLESNKQSLPSEALTCLSVLTAKFVVRVLQASLSNVAEGRPRDHQQHAECSMSVPLVNSFPRSSFGNFWENSPSISSRSSANTSSSAGPIAMETPEETLELQLRQLTLPVYLCAVIDVCLNALGEELTLGIGKPLLLLDQSCRLVQFVMNPSLWDSCSSEAAKVAGHLLHSFKALGSRILYHAKRTERSLDEARHARVVYIGLVKAMYTLLDLVTIRHVDILPGSFRACLPWICQDEALAISYPAIRMKCLEYFQLTHPSGFEAYCAGREVCAAMTSTCEFLHGFHSDCPPSSFSSLAQQALRGLPSLVYHQSERFILHCFRLCSAACHMQPENSRPFVKLMIRMLAYPNTTIRKQTYQILCDFCTSFLNVETAADPIRSPGSDVLFVISEEILREIILYGLFQQETRVYAEHLILLLSQRLLIRNHTSWNRLRTNIRGLFCGLFIHADLESNFGQRVLTWTRNQPDGEAFFDSTTRFRAAFCMLFHPDRLIRGQATDVVQQYARRHIPLHGDTFKPDTQYSFTDLPAAEYSVDGLERSMKIWTDSRMDIGVRWTALRQIHDQLQSLDAQRTFSRLCGPETLVTMLQLIAEGTERAWTSDNIALLLESVLWVLHSNDKFRADSANDMDFYENIVYVFSIIPPGTSTWDSIQCIASSILFLLTFSEMIVRKDGCLSICCTFYRRIIPPCHIMFHDYHQNQAKSNASDLLRSPVGEMLVMHWNVCVRDDIESLLTADSSDGNLDFAPRLMLDDRGRTMLEITHPVYGFEESCKILESAGSHTEGVAALDVMAAYQIMWSFQTNKERERIRDLSECILRYTTVLPHNSSDHNLLSAVVNFVAIVAEKGIRSSAILTGRHWVHRLIIDQRSLFMEAVRKTIKELSLLAAGKASLRVPYIASCGTLMRSSWRLFEAAACVINGDEWDIAHILEIFVETLRSNLDNPLKNVGTVGSACRCVAHFSSLPLVTKQPETIPFVPHLIDYVLALSRSATDLAVSFLGRSIMRSASLALLNLSTYQVEYGMFPAMLESWKNGEEGDLLWLLPLWANRDPITRACGMNIAAALSGTKEGRKLIIRCFRFVPGGVWNAALSFLFSSDEPDIVKWSAVKLLTALLQNGIRKNELRLRDESKDTDLEGSDALLVMLDQLEFYRIISQALQDFNHARDGYAVAEYLVAAIFELCTIFLLRVGSDIVTKLIEAKFFHAALHVCFLTKSFISPSPRLPDRLNLFAKLYGLISVGVTADENLVQIVAHNMHAAGAAFALLDVSLEKIPGTRALWLNIYTALCLCLTDTAVKDGVWKFLSDYRRTIFGSFKFILSLARTESENQPLQVALISFAEVITVAERPELEEFLWEKHQEGDAVGGVLTNFLVRKFDEPTAWEVPSWSDLLKRLLLRYESVRRTAMDCGLVETVIDNLLEMDSTISKDLHVHSRAVLKKKMVEPVTVLLELLMNLMFCNVEAKRLATKKGLASVLISLWITIINDTESLHILFLRLLCTFGARCQESLSSFVRESEHYHTMPLTLFHVIITDLEEQLALPLPHPEIAPLLFDLLGQMSLNPQCRVFIRKSISVKKAMPIPSSRKPKAHQVLDAMWLHVLGNLSFFGDGLVVILAREDICSTLFDYLEIDGLFKEIYISSMLILRNLAFSKKGMARLTGARGVLAKLLRLSSVHAEPKVRLYALSCLLEVLHDQVKLRHAAKAISFDELNHARNDDEPQMFDLRARLIACLEDRPDPSASTGI